MKFNHLFLSLIWISTVAFPVVENSSKLKCEFYGPIGGGGGAGSGSIHVGQYSKETYIGFNADNGGDTYVDLAFTRALRELGVVRATQLVSAVSFSPKATSCQVGEGLRNVTCQESNPVIHVRTIELEHNGNTFETTREVKLESLFIETKSQLGHPGTWRWSFSNGAKQADTGEIGTYFCMAGSWKDSK